MQRYALTTEWKILTRNLEKNLLIQYSRYFIHEIPIHGTLPTKHVMRACNVRATTDLKCVVPEIKDQSFSIAIC